MENLMDKIVALTKRRGFIFPGSEIYGGLNGTWDLGPLGVLLANNIKKEWRKSLTLNESVVEIDSSVLLNPKVWEASGHTSSFSDPLVECRNCHQRHRVDQLVKTSDYEPVIKEFKVVTEKTLDDVNVTLEKINKLLSTYEEILAKRDMKDLTDDEIKALKVITDKASFEIKENEKRLEKIDFILKEAESFKMFYGFFTWIILNRLIPCPDCGKFDWTPSREFNLMFKTYVGSVEDAGAIVFLRPETAQGIFINFKNVIETMRVKIPFGISQIGKGFRNEITTGNSLFRVREFEMMELEYFVKPDEASKAHDYWKNKRLNWYLDLGIKKENIKLIDLPKADLAHYSKGTSEIHYNWPFMGFAELEGIANRGDYDLKRHSEFTGKKLEVADSVGAIGSGVEPVLPSYTPYVIEPSVGIGRAMLAFLIDSYFEDNDRVVLKLHPRLAPYKAAVFPLLANKKELWDKADRLFKHLNSDFDGQIYFDDRGNIGKRYFYQDEIGTPFTITVDFQTLEDQTVTIRDRDSAKQERVKIEDVTAKLRAALLA